MKKVFISQPMVDKTNEKIEATRKEIITKVSEMLGDDCEIIDSFFKDAPHDARPLWFLGKSFELLSTADAVWFGDGWEKYRGCTMEHEAAVRYGLNIVKD